MLGEIQWLTFKTKKQREKEEAEYLLWAFPYGIPQKEKIVSILKELFPKDDSAQSLVAFLTCKEVYSDACDEAADYFNTIKIMKKTLLRYKRIVNQADLPYYMALVFADAKVGPELDYPSAERIKELAKNDIM